MTKLNHALRRFIRWTIFFSLTFWAVGSFLVDSEVRLRAGYAAAGLAIMVAIVVFFMWLFYDIFEGVKE